MKDNINRIPQNGLEMNPLNQKSDMLLLNEIHQLIEHHKIYTTSNNILRETVVESDNKGYWDQTIQYFIDEYLIKIPYLGIGIKNKYENSNCKRLLKGDIVSDEIDTMVNTFALIFALFLTIVPGYALNLSDGSTLTYLENNISICEIDGTDRYWYNLVYIPMWNMVMSALFLNIFGLCLILSYYVLRPRGMKHFQKWWLQGGLRFLFILLLMFLTSIFTTLFPILYYGFWIDVSYHDLCDQVQMVRQYGAYALIARYRNAVIVVTVFWAFIVFFVVLAMV